MDQIQKEFLKELKNLLKKYNAGITFAVSDTSDTYGLSDERLEIYIDNKTICKINGWSMDKTDL